MTQSQVPGVGTWTLRAVAEVITPAAPCSWLRGAQLGTSSALRPAPQCSHSADAGSGAGGDTAALGTRPAVCGPPVSGVEDSSRLLPQAPAGAELHRDEVCSVRGAALPPPVRGPLEF